jgi:hypothetical protein
MKIKSTGSVFYIDAIDTNTYYNSGNYSVKSYEGSSGYESNLVNVCYSDDQSVEPTPTPDPKGSTDLGTAGVWAAHNVGANSETEYGEYYTYSEALALA